MLKSDLHPPRTGLGSDPVVYGVAAALADLFPPVTAVRAQTTSEPDEDDEPERD